ncbi:hypothetical protein KDN24_14615 [Bacillus sp. Bva_UNVM-123]|uniref:hypothetical protein n=2 Tax=Bacillus sp. Bva_UNVM-123 TaxID=2829798 RepID=UPI00391F82AB
MQVSNYPTYNQIPISDQSIELRQGEVYQATIKEKLSENEAMIQIRGRDQVAMFEDGVPSENRVTVQVNGQKDQVVQVKTIATENAKLETQISSEEKILKSVGLTGKESAGLKQAVQILLDKGSPLSKEIVNDLKAFIDQAEGPLESKIETVKALANKRLEATHNQLRAIHEALHGKPLNEVLTDLAKEIDPEFKLESNERVSGRQQEQAVPKMPSKETETVKIVEQQNINSKETIANEGTKQIQQAKTANEASELVRKSRELIENEPDLKKAIQQIREAVVNNPKIDRELAQQIEKVAAEAEKLQSIGKERLLQALKEVEAQFLKKELTSAQSNIGTNQTRGTATVSNQEGSLANLVKGLQTEVSKDPNILRSIEKIRNQMSENSRFPKEVVEKVSRAIEEATALARQGRMTAGKDVLTSALSEVQAEVEKVEGRGQQPAQPIGGMTESSQRVQTSQPVQAMEANRAQAEVRMSDFVREVKAQVQQEPNLERAIEKVRDQIVNNPKITQEVAQKIEQALRETAQIKQMGQESAGRERLQQALAKAEVELKQVEARQPSTPTEPPRQPAQSTQGSQATQQERNAIDQRPSETASSGKIESQANRQPVEVRLSEIVKEVKAEIQREPNLERAIEKVRDQVVNHPKIEREVAQKIEQALRETAQLKQIGEESAGRERLEQALAKAEVELKQVEARQPSTPSEPPRQPVQSTQGSQLDRGTIEHKSEVVKADAQLATKESELKDSLKQIREQLQTEPDPKKVLQKVQEHIVNNKNIDPEVSRNIERLANQANQLDQAGRERLIKMLQQVESALKQNAQAKITESSSSTNTKEQQALANQQQNSALDADETLEQQVKLAETKPSETIKQALQQLQKESNLEQALNQMRKEITSNPNIDMKTIDKAEKALQHATQLHDKGREIAARQHLSKELTEIQQELVKTEPKQTQQQPLTQDQYDINEQLQSMQIQSKDILVTKVTQKLAQATHDFRELKREIVRNLDNVNRLVDTFKNNAYPQAKQMLETAISKLDNAILKSEMMLFTDMKTEKQLMQASSQLAEAKKLLAKGDHTQANKIINEVKTLVDKLIFKPTEQKIMHFVNKESMALENRSPSQNLLAQYGQATANQEPSARQMFEMVRSLGLNHDSDIANSLVFQKNGESQQEQHQQQNLKAALLKLTQGEEANSKVAQQAEQALTNLTGQQLLSKSDASGTLQSMFFNLPMLLGGKPENLQVFINSKNEGQQVDWENCNLYFLLETRKLGDVGILLNSTDRNLSITIKNDMPRFKERMEPLAALTKEKLQEVGYNVNSIHFTRMNAAPSKPVSHEKQDHEVKPTRPVFTEKGMDFKI